MITLFRSNTLLSLSELQQKLYAHIKNLPQAVSFIGTPQEILRYEFVCQDINCLTWLHNQHIPNKIYWSDRRGDFETAGIHIADEITDDQNKSLEDILKDMNNQLSVNNPHVKYFGGFRFNPDAKSDQWYKFGKYHFIIPQFEVCHYKNEKETVFAFNIALKDITDENIASLLKKCDAIDFSNQTTFRKTPTIVSREDKPNKEQWSQIFNTFMDKPSNIEKIVLARESNFEFDVNIRPSALIKHLKEKTPNCFHFCFQLEEHLAFIGASPERLFKRHDNHLWTEAIAGTIRRGANEEEDSRFAQELLTSSKNMLEHQYVVSSIKDSLAKLAEILNDNPDCQVLTLKGTQHLITRFEAKLLTDKHDDAILKHLHPTPAVAGTPLKEAIDTIDKLEPFDRGWYAAPMGYVGYNTSEFAVAIRSGLVQNNHLSLYSGAGIVEGSKLEEEWEEIENKISRFMKIFE